MANEEYLECLAIILQDLLRRALLEPGGASFERGRAYIRALSQYSTARQMQERLRTNGVVEESELLKELRTSSSIPESPFEGILIPETLPIAEWEAKYSKVFRNTLPPGYRGEDDE